MRASSRGQVHGLWGSWCCLCACAFPGWSAESFFVLEFIKLLCDNGVEFFDGVDGFFNVNEVCSH